MSVNVDNTKTLYQTKVVTTGGRNGTARSEDGLLELELSLPSSLGGKGNHTNPEQLFAAGYASCFANAIIHVARSKKIHLREADVEVSATVKLHAT